MSQQNVEIVRRVYARWSRGDFQATLDVADPLVLFVQPLSITVEAGPILGVENLVGYMRTHLASFRHVAIEAEDVTDAGGGTVVAKVRQSSVGRASGAATELRYFQAWSFRGRKLIRLENFRDQAELEAIGLSEQDTHADS
jgi:ketosteroid isomerase-like protein